MKRVIHILIFISLVFGSLQAQVYVDASATGVGDGSSWTDAFTDLQSALDLSMPSSIWIASGEYTPTFRDSAIMYHVTAGHSLYGGFNGTESTFEERDPDTNKTILNGDVNGDDDQEDFALNRTDNAKHLLYIGNGLTEVNIDGISFLNASTNLEETDEFESFWYRGAGIYTLSKINVNNCTFLRNSGLRGSAVYVLGTDQSKISNCTFGENYALSQGVLQLTGCIQPQITDCKFTNNIVTRGAVYPFDCIAANFERCEFIDNIAHPDAWGGIGFYSFASLETLLTDCVFEGNISDCELGGNAAVLYCDGSTFGEDFPLNLVMSGCNFKNNSSVGVGEFGFGANLYFWNSRYTMVNCNLDGNNSPYAAGIYNGNTKFEISETTFEDNVADFGAATISYRELTEGVFNNCTFRENTSNTSGAGGMIGLDAIRIDFNDCLFEGNNASFGGVFYFRDAGTEANFNKCRFLSNSAINGGGAITNFGGNTIHICKSLFEANRGSFGGAINMVDDTTNLATLNIDKTIFSFNFADQQGGAINLGNVDAKISYSQFSSNEALDVGNGGAISNNSFEDQNSNLELVNCTLVDNAGELSGGLANYQDVSFSGNAIMEVTNSILWNLNAVTDYAVEDGNPILMSGGGNLVFSIQLQDLFNANKDLFDADPSFADFNNFDFRLSGTSPCIDGGVVVDGLTEDLNGNPMVGLPDKGCYEFDGMVSAEKLISDRYATFRVNPTTDMTTLDLKHNYQGEVVLTILSLDGRRIRNFSYNKPEEQVSMPINVVDLTAGTYLVNVQIGNIQFTKPLVKQ